MHYKTKKILETILEDLAHECVILINWRDLQDHQIKELIFSELSHNCAYYSDLLEFISPADEIYLLTPERLEKGIFEDDDFYDFLVEVLSETFLLEVTREINEFFDALWMINPTQFDAETVPNSYFM